MSLVNNVTRRRLDLAQHRNLFLNHLLHLPRSGRYLSDEASRIDKSKLDDVSHPFRSPHVSQSFIDIRASQKSILLNRLTLTSISRTKTGKPPLPICTPTINEKVSDHQCNQTFCCLGCSARPRTPVQSSSSIVIDPA